jgi:hypothetical protein
MLGHCKYLMESLQNPMSLDDAKAKIQSLAAVGGDVGATAGVGVGVGVGVGAGAGAGAATAPVADTAQVKAQETRKKLQKFEDQDWRELDQLGLYNVHRPLRELNTNSNNNFHDNGNFNGGYGNAGSAAAYYGVGDGNGNFSARSAHSSSSSSSHQSASSPHYSSQISGLSNHAIDMHLLTTQAVSDKDKWSSVAIPLHNTRLDHPPFAGGNRNQNDHNDNDNNENNANYNHNNNINDSNTNNINNNNESLADRPGITNSSLENLPKRKNRSTTHPNNISNTDHNRISIDKSNPTQPKFAYFDKDVHASSILRPLFSNWVTGHEVDDSLYWITYAQQPSKFLPKHPELDPDRVENVLRTAPDANGNTKAIAISEATEQRLVELQEKNKAFAIKQRSLLRLISREAMTYGYRKEALGNYIKLESDKVDNLATVFQNELLVMINTQHSLKTAATMTREQITRRETAALKIQGLFRGKIARMYVESLRGQFRVMVALQNLLNELANNPGDYDGGGGGGGGDGGSGGGKNNGNYPLLGRNSVGARALGINLQRSSAGIVVVLLWSCIVALLVLVCLSDYFCVCDFDD